MRLVSLLKEYYLFMRHAIQIIIFFIVLLVSGCSKENDNPISDSPMEMLYDFNTTSLEWQWDYTDYFVNMEESIEFDAGLTPLPAPLDTFEAALAVGGTNVSDDLFMFIKTRWTGLEPNTTYRFSFEVTFASNIPDGTVGIGGSPGESVFIKAGAVNIEPMKVRVEDEYLINIDKGNQARDGVDVTTLGDFSNDTDQEIFTLKTVSNEDPFLATTDEEGAIWVLIGTESGFEGRTRIYYDKVRIKAEK